LFCGWVRTSNGKDKTKAKYRDLSTAAAKCAAFGRDDVCFVVGLGQATAKTKQKLNTGISPLRRQSAPPSVEMTFFAGEKEPLGDGGGD
jgi:hypothetical protein